MVQTAIVARDDCVPHPEEPPCVDDNQQHTTISAASTSHCHLLELPAELRNEIYSLVLTTEAEATINFCAGHKRFSNLLALTESCKQIHEESADIFFKVNHVKFVLPILEVFNQLPNLTRQMEEFAMFAIEEMVRRFNGIVFSDKFASRLREVHIHLGTESPDQEGLLSICLPFRQAARGIAHLRKCDVRVRLSFGWICTGNSATLYDFCLTDKVTMMAAMDECYARVALSGPHHGHRALKAEIAKALSQMGFE